MKTSNQWMKMSILPFMEPDVQQCNVQFNAGVIFCHTEQDPRLSCQGHDKEGLELADPFTLYSESKHIS